MAQLDNEALYEQYPWLRPAGTQGDRDWELTAAEEKLDASYEAQHEQLDRASAERRAIYSDYYD